MPHDGGRQRADRRDRHRLLFARGLARDLCHRRHHRVRRQADGQGRPRIPAAQGMIFFSESALIEPSRRPEWDEWYKGHLAAMASVPGVLSAQRFAALGPGVPPSLAMYTVTSPAMFESEIYLNVRGMG